MKSFSSTAIITGIGIIAAIALLAWLLIAQDSPTPLRSEDTITVAASIFPIADIAENVAGDHANVIQLLPSGASPHSYTLTPRQLADIQNARALFAIGHGLDTWATQALTNAGNIPVTIVDGNIQLQEFEDEHDEHADEEEADDHGHEEGSIDPHYWLTISNGQEIARTIARTLQEIDPARSSDYEENLQDYLAELDEAEAELQATVRQASKNEFVSVHDAWGYFTDHYNLELVATYEPVEGREPTVRDIQELQEAIRDHGITTFFTEPQKRSTSATQFLQNELGLKIEVLDPLGGAGVRDSYVDIIQENIRAIVGQ